MAVLQNEIKFYLTGAGSDGGVQTDPNASLGNYRSATEIIDAVVENLLDNVSDGERIAGDIEYRCFCVKNTNSVDSIINATIWIESDTGSIEDDVSFAVEVPTGGDISGNAQSVINESTAPIVASGNASAWSDATSKGAGLGVNQGSHDANLDANEIIFVWVRRTISPGASPAAHSVVIRIEGED
jgi:hypothetical protein